MCSGCTGVYEDPDRSSWEADPEDEDVVKEATTVGVRPDPGNQRDEA